MNYQITTLIDNCVYGRHLQAEHGLSLYIETPYGNLLFDTGASDLFIRNARLLHIDLATVDYLVLSHGHSDHAGGLHHFLALNQRATVVCTEAVFARKFKGERENGIHPLVAKALDRSRFRFINQPTELLPGIHLFPAVDVVDESDTHFTHFLVEEGGERVPDRFRDELAMVLLTDTTYSVLSACSHRGITNVLRAVEQAFPQRMCDLVLGGFHIHLAGAEKYAVIADYFQQKSPCRMGVCHCTGVDQYAAFVRDMGEKVFYNHTGNVLTI